MILDVWPQSYNNFLISTREHGKNFPTLIACKGGKSGLQTGKRGLPAGKKVPSGSLRPPARMNKGGRPYHLERPPFYIGADGRIRLSILCSGLSSRTAVTAELLQLAKVELWIKGISQQTPMARESQSSKRRLSGSRGC